jgi:hypothetical protein
MQYKFGKRWRNIFGETYVFVIMMVQNFKMFCWILENRILVNRKWKLGKWNSSDLVESTTKLKLEFQWSQNLLTAFSYFELFWSESGFQCFSKKILRKFLKKIKISNFFFSFFNKLMLSECSLAISCYFYTPKYPQKSGPLPP